MKQSRKAARAQAAGRLQQNTELESPVHKLIHEQRDDSDNAHLENDKQERMK